MILDFISKQFVLPGGGIGFLQYLSLLSHNLCLIHHSFPNNSQRLIHVSEGQPFSHNFHKD